jgi:hypothetical protein
LNANLHGSVLTIDVSTIITNDLLIIANVSSAKTITSVNLNATKCFDTDE